MYNVTVPFVIFFLKKWKLLVINLILCCILAFVYAFFIAKKQYMASTTFIPMSSSKSVLSLAQLNLSDLTSGVEVSPDQIKIIFESVTLRKEILERFNYYKKLNLEKSPNPLKLGMKALEKDLLWETSEKGSLGVTEILSFQFSCYHSSPDTALQITQYIFHYIDSVITKISTSRAYETKTFIANQLTMAEQKLDSLQFALNLFQKENKAYEIPEQLKLTIVAYGELKSQFMANEIQLKSLSKEMASGSPELAVILKENRILAEKMKSIEKDNSSNILIGFEKYSDLLPQFTNFLREVETQLKLVALLTQQYEEAKINESKQISNLIVIDRPMLPQYKERPKRIFLLVSIVAVYYAIFISVLSVYYFYTNLLKNSNLYNEIIAQLVKK